MKRKTAAKYTPSDQSARTEATTSRAGPSQSDVCATMPLPPSRNVSRRVMEAICVAVFHFPSELTATALCASPPAAAAHSRSALMVISRPMMAVVASGSSHCAPAALGGVVHRRMSAAATMSLSATGSRKAPNADDAFRTRARYPSSQSVKDAPTKMPPHTAGAHGAGQKYATKRTGIAATRRSVRIVGSVSIPADPEELGAPSRL
mmetsp:Transcript_18341/g.59715  ORF Transcript_18341/g.59715 Transcript_18341/m.59715 type:complete len:206 (+) Transcript_18341:60-677(+)